MQQNKSLVQQRCTLLDLILDWPPDLREVILHRMRSYPERQDEIGLEKVAGEMVTLIEASETATEAAEKIKNLPSPA